MRSRLVLYLFAAKYMVCCVGSGFMLSSFACKPNLWKGIALAVFAAIGTLSLLIAINLKNRED